MLVHQHLVAVSVREAADTVHSRRSHDSVKCTVVCPGSLFLAKMRVRSPSTGSQRKRSSGHADRMSPTAAFTVIRQYLPVAARPHD